MIVSFVLLFPLEMITLEIGLLELLFWQLWMGLFCCFVFLQEKLEQRRLISWHFLLRLTSFWLSFLLLGLGRQRLFVLCRFILELLQVLEQLLVFVRELEFSI
jgi:hypothetical protein